MSSPNPDQVVSDLLARCEASLVSRNFEEAIDGCRAVLSVSPENQRAKELLEEAQSKLEAELFVRENLRKAREYFQLREFQKCVNECQKVQLLQADNLEAADLMKQAQDKVEAEPFIQNFVNSAQSLFNSGLYDEAFAQWDKVRAIDPFYPGLDELMNKARRMMVGPQPPDARFESTPERHDTSAPPAFEIPEEETTEISLEEFGSLGDEEKIQYLLRQGDRAFNVGQYQKAIEVWSEIFMLDVNHAGALQKIEEARSKASEQRSKVQELLKEAQAAYDEGRIHEAKDLFEQVKSYDPANGQAEKYLGMIGGTEGGPATLEDLLVLATAAENRGQYREAAQYYSQALAVDSENAELADRIKNLNMLAKKQEQGKTVLGNAKAFLAEGKLDSARHALSKILEADPENKEALELMKEVKSISAGTGPGASAGVAAPAIPIPSSPVSVARAKKSIPIVTLAIAAIVVLGAGGAMAYFFLLRPDPAAPSRHSNTKPRNVVKTNSTTPAPPKRVNSTMVTPAAKEKALRLVQEAQVLFMEKKYPDVITKAEEALKLDPENKDAKDLKATSEKNIAEGQATERKLLDDANTYFAYSEFAGAVKLYEKYLQRHPEAKLEVQPQIVKCYYNMGVISIRLWRCDIAADYFRQVLFIDKADLLSNDALNLARRCEQTGSGDADVRKAVSMLEMRK